MTYREEMLAAIAGRPTARIPWAPRMDLWCIARRARGDLPAEFDGLNTAEIAAVLDVACHAVRADFTLPREPQSLVLRGLGIDNHPDFPYRVELRGLPVEFRHDAENQWTRIRAPAGEVSTHLKQTAAMTQEGISLPFVLDYAMRTPDDFEAVAQVFEHLEVIPTPEAYATFRARVGEGGLAVAGAPIAASPVHLILHELVAMDQFFYLYADARPQMDELAARMEPYFEACLEAVASCEAEVVFWGGNYDRNLTWPPFFEERIAPWLKRVGERLHAAGKYLLTHTDGENEGLMPLYRECAFDVAESVCPAPMTQLSLAELRQGMGEEIAIWGGIPSVALMGDSMDAAAFESYIDAMFESLGDGRHLILGVSDNVPPDADLDRLERIKQRIETFGPVPG